jgi:hypothetical protein
MLWSVIPDRISPEGKFNNFFQLAKDENVWEQWWKTLQIN